MVSPGFKVKEATGSKPLAVGNVERRSRGTRRIRIMLRFLVVRRSTLAVSSGPLWATKKLNVLFKTSNYPSASSNVAACAMLLSRALNGRQSSALE